MTEIDAKLVAKLRNMTGAGMMDCKCALLEAKQDIEQAVKILREKGIAKSSKRADHSANQGLIHSYIHTGGRIGAMLELNCETDFVAKTDDFQCLAREIALQIAAANPKYLSPEDVPKEVLESEKEIYRKQLEGEKKPAHALEKIIEGKLNKFYEEQCLLNQLHIRDQKTKIDDLIKEKSGKLGEKIVLRRFVRFQLGEELEVKK